MAAVEERGIEHPRVEAARFVAQVRAVAQDGDPRRERLRCGQVGDAFAGEVRRDEPSGAGSERGGGVAGEPSVAVVAVDLDPVGGIRVGDGQVEVPVAIEISQGQIGGEVPGLQDPRAAELPQSIVEDDCDRVSVAAADDHVGRSVAVQVADGKGGQEYLPAQARRDRDGWKEAQAVVAQHRNVAGQGIRETTRSGLPSRFTSAIATSIGFEPAVCALMLKPPLPLLLRTATLLNGGLRLAAARSISPSPSRSPAARATGPTRPVRWLAAISKAPVPRLRRIATEPLVLRQTARSTSPSPSKSPAARHAGPARYAGTGALWKDAVTAIGEDPHRVGIVQGRGQVDVAVAVEIGCLQGDRRAAGQHGCRGQVQGDRAAGQGIVGGDAERRRKSLAAGLRVRQADEFEGIHVRTGLQAEMCRRLDELLQATLGRREVDGAPGGGPLSRRRLAEGRPRNPLRNTNGCRSL